MFKTESIFRARAVEMCNRTLYQFLSGFLVGVVMCFWMLSIGTQIDLMRNQNSSNATIRATQGSAKYSVFARLLNGWMESNRANRNNLYTLIRGKESSGNSLHFKKTFHHYLSSAVARRHQQFQPVGIKDS